MTQAGKQLLPLAKHILERIDNAVESMSDISKLISGRVTIAAAIVLAATFLPSRIASFMQLNPDIRVNLRDVAETEIRALLMSGEADIGIGTSPMFDDELAEMALFADHFALFCPATDVLARKKSVSWPDLIDRSFVTLSAENPLQRRIDSLLETKGVTVQRQFTVRFSTTLLALVNQGLGIGILPAGSRGLSPKENVVMRPIARQAAPRMVVALTVRERTLSPAAQSFLLHIAS
jgi:LysR family carnitine catabolism transcriptional activator